MMSKTSVCPIAIKHKGQNINLKSNWNCTHINNNIDGNKRPEFSCKN